MKTSIYLLILIPHKQASFTSQIRTKNKLLQQTVPPVIKSHENELPSIHLMRNYMFYNNLTLYMLASGYVL